MAGVTLDVYGLVVGHAARLEPLPRRAALGPMLREALVGGGV